MVMGEATLTSRVVVIGGGPGGYAAAFRAASLGLETALVNAEERLGGVCLLRGCIPAKSLLEMAKLIRDARGSREMGLTFGEPEIDLEALRAWKDGIVDRLSKGLESLCRQHDINLIKGRAVFQSSGELRILDSDLAHIKFENAILATGSEPVPLPGTEFRPGGRVMSSDGALDLRDIPETLLVVGGGYNGVELGTVYAELGSRVTLVEMSDGLLKGADRELVRILDRRVRETLADVRLETKVSSIEEREDGVAVVLAGPDGEEERRFDRALVAVGRRPLTKDIGLEKTKVELDEKGFVKVDETRRTADPKIFAVGDATGNPMLAHKAIREGRTAAEVIAGEPSAFDPRCIPAVVYSDPEIAWCGLTEEDARRQGLNVKAARFPWKASGRAQAMVESDGLTKLILDARTGRVLGIGIVGRGAETMISEGVLAIEMGALAEDLALTIHPHPTLSETEEEAAAAFLGEATHIFSKSRKEEKSAAPKPE